MNTCIKMIVVPALLSVLLWGCAEEATQLLDPIAADAAASGRKNASARGSVSGAVSVNTPPGSIIIVALGRDYDDLTMGRVLRGQAMRKSGPFHFRGVRPGTYRVGAFVDLNGNRVPDIPLEPYIVNSSAISISPGEHVTGISVEGFYNERVRSFKTPERARRYEDLLAESKEQLERAYEKLEVDNSDLLYDVIPSLRGMIFEAERAWPVAGNLSDWEQITGLLEPVSPVAQGAYEGKNLLNDLRGCYLRAYVSELDGSIQRYAVAIPQKYDGSKPFPLIIALHGAGGDHWAGLKMVAGFSAYVIGAEQSNRHFFPPDLPPDFIIACPNGHGFRGPGYRAKGEYDVMKVLKEMFANYNIDADRVYLTGASKGGRGTWEIGMKHPELFAAIAPVAGAPNRAEKLVGDTGEMKFYVFHGRRDKIMPIASTHRMIVMLTEAGAYVDYEEYEDMGHEASVFAYADGNIIQRFRE
jgi:predicted esterase